MPSVWQGALPSKVIGFSPYVKHCSRAHKKTNAFYPHTVFLKVFHSILIEGSKGQRMKLLTFFLYSK